MSVIRSFQPAFTTGEVSPALAARVDLQKYDSAAKLLQNVVVRPEGGATKAPGTRFIADTGNVGRVRLIDFAFSMEESQNYVLEFSARRIRVIGSDGLVVDGHGNPVSIASPYAESDLFSISHAQSADVVYLAHPRHAPRKLMRYSHTDWRLETMTFLPKTPVPQGLTAAFSGGDDGTTREWRYVVTAIDVDTGEESLPSETVSVVGAENMRTGAIRSHSDGHTSALPDRYVSIAWNGALNANEYRVYKETSAGSGMFGYIGSSGNVTFTDRNIAPNAEDSPPVDFNPFLDGNNPACVAIHQQRLIFGCSVKSPNTLWMSRTGNYENFTKSARVKDDDYIEATLASRRVDPVVWIVSLRELIVGTTGSEWGINGGGNGRALTPGGVNAVVQSSNGSSRNLTPVIVGNTVLHVDRYGKGARDLLYDFGSDSYGGTERSLYASHLFEGRHVVDMAYQHAPHFIVWFVMSDGMAVGLTWIREQEIFAWHRHTTDGAYEAVCVVPGNGQDQVFFVVRRQVNGRTVRYIEKQENRFAVHESYYGLDDGGKRDVSAQAFFVHSGLSYEGTPVSEVHGLGHLEGKEVAILADGGVPPRLTVKGGRVTLRHPASVIHVGLPYLSAIETVNFEPNMKDGVVIGRPKRIARVAVKFQDSSAVYVGVNGRTVEAKWRSDEPYGIPPRLRSGTAVYAVPGTWGPESSVTIRSDVPTPFTVLSIVPEVALD